MSLLMGKEMSHVDFGPLQGSITQEEYILFRDYVLRSCGIVIPPEKAYLFETRLAKLMLDTMSDSFSDFYQYVRKNTDPTIRQKIINAITTNETQWFRDDTPWRVLEETLLPRYVNELLSGRKPKIRIWSTAVSTGQEIYSTAMCVDNYLRKNRVMGVRLSDFEFFATDVSSRVLDMAQKGRYDRISISRGLSDDYREKYFAQSGAAWELDPRIREAVKFSHFNLQSGCDAFGLFDIIFCRYVLIYFSDELKKKIITELRHSLINSGVLFTGSYALYDLFRDDFDMKHYQNLTYYVKKVG